MSEGGSSRRRPGSTTRARLLRRAGNVSEARLWDELKDRRLGGFKFVRQHPIGPFFADFACRERRLVVEIDGSHHAASAADARRDAYMLGLGWSVLRLWNVDVLLELTAVCETILAALDGRLTEDVIAADMKYLKAKPDRR